MSLKGNNNRGKPIIRANKMNKEERAEIFTRLSKIEEHVTRILFIIDNDNNTNQKGLVESVKIMEKEIEVLKTEKKIIYAKASAYGGIGAFLVGLVSWIIGMVFNIFFK